MDRCMRRAEADEVVADGGGAAWPTLPCSVRALTLGGGTCGQENTRRDSSFHVVMGLRAKSDYRYHWVRLLNAIHTGTGMHNIGDRDECKELVRYLYALCNEL